MKIGHPLISVVIPCYNEEKYIRNCLASFHNQTFNKFEIIVVDNNCSDNTAEIASSLGAKVVKESIQGMIPAREKGFKEAKAEIIARTDADATVASDWLEVIYNAFQSNPKLVGLTGTLISPYKKVPNNLFRCWSYILAKVLGNLFAGHTHLIGPNMAVRKSAWQKVKVHLDDKQVHEDIDLSCHLAETGEIRYLPQMKATLSMRKVQEKPIRGISQYLLEYPTRYLKTIAIHHPRFHHHHSIRPGK